MCISWNLDSSLHILLHLFLTVFYMYKKYPDYCGPPVLITPALSQFMSSLSLTGTYFDNRFRTIPLEPGCLLGGETTEDKDCFLQSISPWEWLDPCELLSDPQLTDWYRPRSVYDSWRQPQVLWGHDSIVWTMPRWQRFIALLLFHNDPWDIEGMIKIFYHSAVTLSLQCEQRCASEFIAKTSFSLVKTGVYGYKCI